jgi:hypothetical protein
MVSPFPDRLPRFPFPSAALAVLVAIAAVPVIAKPIAFQDGWTVMAEHGTNTMLEAQVFYAPRSWWSGGLSFTKLMADDRSFEREVPSVQLNYLVKRWNLPNAQGNVFAWGGIGSARGFDAMGRFSGLVTGQGGIQADFETRSFYASAKSGWFHSQRFSHGVNTIQLGIAPYEHDYEDLAVWLVVQARRYTGGILPGKTEVIPMLRLFKGNFWIEGGVDREKRVQLMLMMNF